MSPKTQTVDRYTNLFAALSEIRSRGINYLYYLEVGTYDGERAAQLLSLWRDMLPTTGASYYGFDLWEELTPELSALEFSKPKPPPSVVEARARLVRTGASVALFQGNTRLTLPSVISSLPPLNLIFIDGGHSLETIASDWAAIAPRIGPHTIVLLDDYYLNRQDVGCHALVEGLGPEYEVIHLDPVDHYEHTGINVRMVRVRIRAGAPGPN